MGSSSLPASLACGSNDSLNGLKFGKKIYFEDGGGGGSSSKASSGQAPAKKGKIGVQGVQQPPRCQVEGCNVDLSDTKAYYSKHKVCGMHSKSPKVIVAGLEQRFCQQCSRSVFNKHSCVSLFDFFVLLFFQFVCLFLYLFDCVNDVWLIGWFHF